MKSIRNAWAALLIGVFAIAVFGTGCDDTTPEQKVPEIIIDSNEGPSATRVPFTTARQQGSITLTSGAPNTRVDLSAFTVTGTVSSDSIVGMEIMAGAPLTIQSITPNNPWPMPCTGITDQPVLIQLGDTTSVRR